MLTVAEHVGGATDTVEQLRRARSSLAAAADALAAACRDPLAPPLAVADAEDRVARAFWRFSGLMLTLQAEKR
jgi:hypothetical protein